MSKIYTCVITHRHGTNVHATLTEDELDSEVAEYCRDCWDEIEGLPDVPDKPPTDNRECIEIYFDAHNDRGDGEYAEYSEMKLKDAPILSHYRTLRAGLSDMIAKGRLSEETVPDDYQWLLASLAAISEHEAKENEPPENEPDEKGT